MWHAKEPSLLNCHDCRAHVQIFNRPSALVTSPYWWKVHKWDAKPLTNKNNWTSFLTGIHQLFATRYPSSVNSFLIKQSFFNVFGMHVQIAFQITQTHCQNKTKKLKTWLLSNNESWNKSFIFLFIKHEKLNYSAFLDKTVQTAGL